MFIDKSRIKVYCFAFLCLLFCFFIFLFQNRYEKLVGCPEWAKVTEKKIDSDDEGEIQCICFDYL